MISVNTVIGTFTNITAEQIIDIPDAEKIVFSVDVDSLEISVNDNQHYMLYTPMDGIVEFLSRPNSENPFISKIYVKKYGYTEGDTFGGVLRVWASYKN